MGYSSTYLFCYSQLPNIQNQSERNPLELGIGGVLLGDVDED